MTCDVCDRERDVRVGSLPFAPMSVAFCQECIGQNAYPLWALHTGYDLVDGPDNAADWFKEMRSYADGLYIDGAEVLRRYVPTVWDIPPVDHPGDSR